MLRKIYSIPVLILGLYLSGAVYGTSINRSVTWISDGSGEEITVNLTVDITGTESYYIIDELIPSGWSAKDSGGGSTGHAGHIKWVVITGATDIVYTYVITLPTIQKLTQFVGYYTFEGDTSEKLIGGESILITQLEISGNTNVGSVTLNGLGITSDDSGNYNATVSYDWSGTVTPIKTGYTFIPPNRTYNNITNDKLNQNYTAQVIQADYGMTITSCIISGTTPDAGQAVTLSGTSGQVHAAASGAVMKVVIGFRDNSGHWAGGEPVVISSTIPGTSFQPWTGSNAVINAPLAEGTYYVWVSGVPTIDNAIAIQEFKNAIPTTADEVHNDKYDMAVTVIEPDTTPNMFTFTDQSGAELSTAITSNTITISGINTAATISITGGTYSINGGTYTSAPGTVNNGNTVTVRQTSSSSYLTTTSTTLTIGGVSDTFSVTTKSALPDTTPDQFTFTDQTGVALNTTITSNMITVSGINAAASITISGGTYSINGGSYTNAMGTINNGNTVTVRQISSGSYSTTTNAILTIGGVSGTFSVVTQSASTGNLQVKKGTVTAGKGINEDKDSISISGTIDVTSTEFIAAGEITVNIGGVYEESIDTSLFTARSGKFTYKYRLPRDGEGRITSLVIDTNKHTFSLKVQKVDLTGLYCPFDVEIEIGNYLGISELEEPVINGRRFIPVQLMSGFEDYLQVQSVKVKHATTDTLTIKGGIAYEILPTSMSDVVLKMGNQTFTIPAASFNPSGRSGYKYICKNATVWENGIAGGIASATFDFGKGTFSIVIKNTKINSTTGEIDLTLTIGSFNEQINFNLDTGQTIY